MSGRYRREYEEYARKHLPRIQAQRERNEAQKAATSPPRKRAVDAQWDAHRSVKAPKLHDGHVPSSTAREPNLSQSYPQAAVVKRNHNAHPDSGVSKNFYSAHYPLDLLPSKSWTALHNNDKLGAVCSRCRKPRALNAHQRKLFLVAERLTWGKTVARPTKETNEEALWAVNAELGILDPVLHDEELVIGGKHSTRNAWYPFKDGYEVQTAMELIEKTEAMTQRSWELWKGIVEAMPKAEDMFDDVPEPASYLSPYQTESQQVQQRHKNEREWEEELKAWYDSSTEAIEARIVQLHTLSAYHAHLDLDSALTRHLPDDYHNSALHATSRRIFALGSILRQRREEAPVPYQLPIFTYPILLSGIENQGEQQDELQKHLQLLGQTQLKLYMMSDKDMVRGGVSFKNFVKLSPKRDFLVAAADALMDAVAATFGVDVRCERPIHCLNVVQKARHVYHNEHDVLNAKLRARTIAEEVQAVRKFRLGMPSSCALVNLASLAREKSGLARLLPLVADGDTSGLMLEEFHGYVFEACLKALNEYYRCRFNHAKTPADPQERWTSLLAEVREQSLQIPPDIRADPSSMFSDAPTMKLKHLVPWLAGRAGSHRKLFNVVDKLEAVSSMADRRLNRSPSFQVYMLTLLSLIDGDVESSVEAIVQRLRSQMDTEAVPPAAMPTPPTLRYDFRGNLEMDRWPHPDDPHPPPPQFLATAIETLRHRFPYNHFEPIMRPHVVDSSTLQTLKIDLKPGDKAPFGGRIKYIPKIRCNVCPGKLYAVRPGYVVEDFSVHLMNQAHMSNVRFRLARERIEGRMKQRQALGEISPNTRRKTTVEKANKTETEQPRMLLTPPSSAIEPTKSQAVSVASLLSATVPAQVTEHSSSQVTASGVAMTAKVRAYVQRLLQIRRQSDDALDFMLRKLAETGTLNPSGKAVLVKAVEYCAEHCETLDPVMPSPANTQEPPSCETPNYPRSELSTGKALQLMRKLSFQTLADFYSLLDQLERTSPMAARFLEAYAERLRDEVCKDCWFVHNILSDDDLEDPGKANERPDWSTFQSSSGKGRSLVSPFERAAAPRRSVAAAAGDGSRWAPLEL